jgi:hypothetical protein
MYRSGIYLICAGVLIAAPVKPASKETAVDRLSGIWELRADDGRSGRLILRLDGTLTASSGMGGNQFPDYQGRWYLLEEEGDRFLLEFGQRRGGPGSYNVKITLTCRDAFTVVETIVNRVTLREQNRFVRISKVPNPP